MDTIYYVILFSLIGGLFSLAGAAALLSKKSLSEKLSIYATPFAAGALLAAVFLDLLKEAIHNGAGDGLLYATLAGIVGFFVAERFLHWFHHHHDEDKARKNASKNLIVTGDFMHNILDGVVIAAGFLISVPTGIVTAIAVAAHEIPQEIGDFGLLLSKGMSRKRVLLINMLTALATTLAAIVTYSLGSADKLPLDILIGLSAGFLLYIAMSDIIPTIHSKAKPHRVLDVQPILLLVGVVLVGLIITLAHNFIEHPETDDHGHTESSQVYDAEHAHEGEDHHQEEKHAEEEHGHEEEKHTE